MRFESERSTAALILALLACGVALAGYFAPWLSYDSSTGRQTPEGGFHDPAYTGIERHYIDMGPFSIDGDVAASNSGQAERLTQWIGITWLAGAACFLLMAIAEIPPFTRFMGRTVSLVLGLAALTFLGVAMGLTYYQLPHTMSGLGIRDAFTYELVEPSGYYRSTLGLGWVAAISSVPFAIGAFAFKFQAGSADPSAIEAYRPKPTKPVQATGENQNAH